MTEGGRRVGLFVTCLVDLMRPSIGFAAVKLLEDAGCTVEVPVQSCCGQPAFNSGDRATARAIAEQVIEALRAVTTTSWRRRAPAPACCERIIPNCFRTIPTGARAPTPSPTRPTSWCRSWSTCLASTRVSARFDGAVTYHDSCSGLRELGVHAQPRRLLGTVRGPDADRNARRRCLLRLRRHVLRQISRHLQRHRRQESGQCRRDRRAARCSPATSAA